jgi:hypothetical protein
MSIYQLLSQTMPMMSNALCFASLPFDEQPPQGDLTEVKYDLSAEVDELVPPGQIIHFVGIADFQAQTVSPVPIIVRTSFGDYCIEGWEMVEAARRDQRATILCRLRYFRLRAGIDFQTELALQKVALRAITKGEISYAELVADVKRLYLMLEARTENPLLYGHGGARTQGQTGNGRAENIRWVIQSRLGKDQSTVSEYLKHSKGLSDQVLRRLVEEKANKRLLESLGRYRRRIIMTMKLRPGLDPSAIEEFVFSSLTQMVETYLQDGMEAFRNSAERLIESISSPTTVTASHRNPAYNPGDEDGELQESGPLTVPIPCESVSAPRIALEPSQQVTSTESTVSASEIPTAEQAKARFKTACLDMVGKIESMTDRQLFDEASQFMTELVILRRDIMKTLLQQVGEQVEGGQS